jgi:hypothetical protein
VKTRGERAAIAAYKERKTPAGIYAVRCAAAGRCWVGAALDIGAIRNRLWFTLRLGSNPHRSLQDAWRQHGEDGLTFAPIETLDDDLTGYARDRTLKERLAFWNSELNAEAI